MSPLSRVAPAGMSGQPGPGVPEWIAQAAAGDARAQEQLVREQWPAAERLLARMLGPRDDLEDLLQNVFLETFRALPRFEGKSKLSTFIGGIAVRVALRAMRSSASRPRPLPLGDDDIPAPRSAPDAQAEAALQLARVRELLGELTEVKRVAFGLWALTGMEPADIAELMGASLPATRSRIFYAQKELKAKAAADPRLRALFGGDDD